MDLAAKQRKHCLQSRPIRNLRAGMQYGTGNILCICLDAKAKMREILLFRRFRKFNRFGRFAEKDDKQAGSQRIQRAGMSDASLAENTAELCHNVMTCPVLRLIDKKNPVHCGILCSAASSSSFSASRGEQSSVTPAAM